MTLEFATIYLHLPQAMLVVFRMAGLMLAAPMFSSSSIPTKIKISFVVAMSVVIMPAVWSTLPQTVTLQTAIVGLFGEVMIGMLIGIVVNLLFVGLQVGGLMIGRQAGLAMAQAFNPTTNTQDTILGQVYFLVAMAAFLALNGHHILISALVRSFHTMPVLSFTVGPDATIALTTGLNEAFAVGIRVAGPVLVALFLTSISLNFIAKTMPQLNILVVGFPLRVVMALFIGGLAMVGLGDLITDGLESTAFTLEALLGN